MDGESCHPLYDIGGENRILKNQIKGRLRLTDSERISLARSVSVLAGKRWRKSPRSSDPKPFLVGTANSLP